MIWKSFKSGLSQAWSTKRLVLVLYLASAILGLLIALPVRAVLLDFAGRSLEGAALVNGVSTGFFLELLFHNEAGLVALRAPSLFASAAYLVLSLFLSGGALAVLASGEGYRATDFWGGAAKFFGRFLRLALWSSLLLAALYLLPLTARGLQRIFFGSDPYEYVSYWGWWVRAGLLLTALFFFRICFDYARIHAVAADERRMRVSLWRGLRFALRNPLPVVGLALLIALVGGVALLIYRPLSTAVDGSTVAAVVAAVVAQQAYIVWRVVIRLTRYGSQITLFRELAGDLSEASAPEPPAPATEPAIAEAT